MNKRIREELNKKIQKYEHRKEKSLKDVLIESIFVLKAGNTSCTAASLPGIS